MNKLIDAIKNRSLKTEDLGKVVRSFDENNKALGSVLTSDVRTDSATPKRKPMLGDHMPQSRPVPNRLLGESENTRLDRYGRPISPFRGVPVREHENVADEVEVPTALVQRHLSDLAWGERKRRALSGGIGHLTVGTPNLHSDIHFAQFLKEHMQAGMSDAVFATYSADQILRMFDEEARKMVAEKKAKNKRRRQRRKANMKARRK